MGALLTFAAVAVPLALVVALLLGYLMKRQMASAVTAAQMTQNAEMTLHAFAARVGGIREQPPKDGWGSQPFSYVRYRCCGMEAEMSYTFIQGSSKNERVILPLLVIEPPPGVLWCASPALAISQALAARGRDSCRVEPHRRGFTLHLKSPHRRSGGNFVAPLIEHLIDVESLVQIAEISCHASRAAVDGLPRPVA
jgi:hypothetical protein